MTYTNPRTEAVIDDWPIGRQRCRARFWVETDAKRGERVARTTENKTRTGSNKPKRTAYASRSVIVDGDDGRTYILQLGSHIAVLCGDMQHSREIVFPDDERWPELVKLLGEERPAPSGVRWWDEPAPSRGVVQNERMPRP